MNHRIHRFAFPTLLIAIGVATALVAQAQPVQKEQAGVAFTGKVTAVDMAAKTLSVVGANGEKGSFQIDAEATTVMSGSQDVGLSGIHEGEWVAVDADLDGNVRRATYVEVVEDPGGGKASPARPEPTGATIEIRADALTPALVQIGPGESVTFRNVGETSGGQTVMDPDGSFTSPSLGKGDSWSHSFDVPGVYSVQLGGRPTAKARIVVE